MPRLHRSQPPLSMLIERAITKALRDVGLDQREARQRPRRRKAAPGPRPSNPASLDTPTPPNPPSNDLSTYSQQFPTVPTWLQDLEPGEIVLGVNPRELSCMADAEDGEQPWHGPGLYFVPPPGEDLSDEGPLRIEAPDLAA